MLRALGGVTVDQRVSLVKVFGTRLREDYGVLAGWKICLCSQTTEQLVEAGQVIVDAVFVELHLERGLIPRDYDLTPTRQPGSHKLQSGISTDGGANRAHNHVPIALQEVKVGLGLFGVLGSHLIRDDERM